MKHQKRSIWHRRLILLTALFLFSILSLSIGVKDFSLIGLLSGNDNDLFLAAISRIPRLISIIVTGAGLSIAGLIMQTIMGNRFVAPSTTGTMDWCRFGVMLAILFAGSEATLVKITIAFIVSLIGTLLFIQLLQRMQFKNAIMVPLIGMMMGNVVNAITSFIAYRYDIIQNMSSWMQGNFSLIVRGRYEILYLGIPFLILAYIYASKFTIAGMGEGVSTNLGVDYKAITMVGLVIVAFITSTVVVTVGSISFVGLIVPNLVSLYYGDNLKKTLFETALVGAIFVMICDIIGRLIVFPYEVSISVVVSIIGSILFLVIIFKKKG